VGKLNGLAVCNQFKIMNTWFEHTGSHKFTWSARDHRRIFDCDNKREISRHNARYRVFLSYEIKSYQYMLVSGAIRNPKIQRENKTWKLVLNGCSIPWLYGRWV